MLDIIKKHVRFFTLVAIALLGYGWHVAATPEPKHPRLAKAWQGIKTAAWIFLAGSAMKDQPPEIPPDEYEEQMLIQRQPPSGLSYGDLPDREEVGADGYIAIDHGRGW